MSHHPTARTVGAISLIALVAFILPLALLLVSDQNDPVDPHGL